MHCFTDTFTLNSEVSCHVSQEALDFDGRTSELLHREILAVGPALRRFVSRGRGKSTLSVRARRGLLRQQYMLVLLLASSPQIRFPYHDYDQAPGVPSPRRCPVRMCAGYKFGGGESSV